MTAIGTKRRKADPDWMAEKKAAWQHDFDVIRNRQSLRLGDLVNRHLRVLPPWGLAPIAGLGLLATCIQAALSVWMMRDMRELEADAYAASIIGPAAVLDGIGWVAAWSRQGWTAGRRKRCAALWQAVLAAGPDRV